MNLTQPASMSAFTRLLQSLYASDPSNRYRYDVKEDGTWENRKTFAYTAARAPDGKPPHTLRNPASAPGTNQAFARNRNPLRFKRQCLRWLWRRRTRLESLGKAHRQDLHWRGVRKLPVRW